MPWDKDSLGLEDVLSFVDVLGEDFTFVGDLSVHIIDEEWLSEIVLVVGIWHGLVVKGHGGT